MYVEIPLLGNAPHNYVRGNNIEKPWLEILDPAFIKREFIDSDINKILYLENMFDNFEANFTKYIDKYNHPIYDNEVFVNYLFRETTRNYYNKIASYSNRCFLTNKKRFKIDQKRLGLESKIIKECYLISAKFYIKRIKQLHFSNSINEISNIVRFNVANVENIGLFININGEFYKIIESELDYIYKNRQSIILPKVIGYNSIRDVCIGNITPVIQHKEQFLFRKICLMYIAKLLEVLPFDIISALYDLSTINSSHTENITASEIDTNIDIENSKMLASLFIVLDHTTAYLTDSRGAPIFGVPGSQKASDAIYSLKNGWRPSDIMIHSLNRSVSGLDREIIELILSRIFCRD